MEWNNEDIFLLAARSHLNHQKPWTFSPGAWPSLLPSNGNGGVLAALWYMCLSFLNEDLQLFFYESPGVIVPW